jgi:Transcriptional regulators containing a DNA-binding HTH domain and an aminotransferase domain (MocR family) and their eukaryotic orthologs
MADFKYSQRIHDMQKTADIVQGLFGSMTDPEIISFGGGAPAKEALPIDQIREIANDVLTVNGRGVEALQYGKPLGAQDLREIVAKDLLAPKGVNVSPDNILITAGGLESMNLLCQVFINPGDVILVESPTFVHCVEIFEMFQAKCVPVDMDENGMDIEDCEKKIKKFKPKMVYVIPTFQNPTGITLSQERRERLAALGDKYDVIILEDDPYRDIRFNGKDLTPIKAFDQTGHTVLANSFSKIFSPGSRLGYCVAEKEIINHLCDIKTATNSHTGMISEVLCAEFFKRGYYPEHHRKITSIYRERCGVMMECIDKYFPAGTKHTIPDGGLFTWVELPESINTTEALPICVENKVAYVAGEGFYAGSPGMGTNCMRMSYGAVEPARIKIGCERLGKILCEMAEG